MAKKPPKSGQPWSAADEARLEKFAGQNTPTRVIALKLERSPAAIYNKAQELDLSLKPTNQRPYNRAKKP